MTSRGNEHAIEVGRRLPAKLVAEVRAAMIADPGRYRTQQLDNYHRTHQRQIAKELIATGLDIARAWSHADREVRRRAESAVPALEQFAAGDPNLVDLAAVAELDRVRDRACGSQADLTMALGRLRAWGVLRTTITESMRRHRGRATARAAVAVIAEQQRIVREDVPTWDWPHADVIAPGLHGFVETNRNGAIHIWTMVADVPLSGAGSRFLDTLPPSSRIRVFGVSKGSLSEAMLLRRGFRRSRYSWHGLRRKESVSASAWTWLYR